MGALGAQSANMESQSQTHPRCWGGMQNLCYPQATLPYFSFHQDHITSELVLAEAPLAMPWGMSRQRP